jgi:alkanesulfonate monooxygenase SsuD/methylene tetrahydromethanopterin reductase-like flavin-dependent oxidoreductase (luciferase family)
MTLPLGYFTHVRNPDGPARAFRDTITLAVAAEELGFQSFWVAQHHGGSGGLPSPLVLLAAVAERTSTIRIGTAVIAASLEDPLRLAEDAAVLDVLSGGRLELGVGAGSDAAASARFGRDHARRHEDCMTAVEALRRHLVSPELVPAAAGLERRLWLATGSAAGVDCAAAAGMGLLSGRPDAHADLARYRAWAGGNPRVAASRIHEADEPAERFAQRWRADTAHGLASELIVQTRAGGPGAGVDLGTHLATLQALCRLDRCGALDVLPDIESTPAVSAVSGIDEVVGARAG